MKMILSKTFTFDAAHRLLDYNGKCANLHGHTWKGEVRIINIYSIDKVVPDGILLDFSKIKKIIEKFDHTYLNDLININPTAENLSALICLMVTDEVWKRFKPIVDEHPSQYYKVTVKLWESDSSFIFIDTQDAMEWFGFDIEYEIRKYNEFFREIDNE